jgi:hypothetical protein
MKRLFGGSEFAGDVDSIGLNNTGLAFLLLDGALVLRRPFREAPWAVSLGIQKAFAVPWGYEKFIPGASSGTDSPDSSPAIDPALLRSLFLSGLSVYARISR